MMKSHVFGTAPLAVASLLFPVFGGTGVLHENGISSMLGFSFIGGPFYGYPTYTVYDDFTISHDAVLTTIEWSGMETIGTTSDSTNFVIYSGLPESSETIVSGVRVATRTPSDLNPDSTRWQGFDYQITDLSIYLPAGSYYLGLSLNTNDTEAFWLDSALTVEGNNLYQSIDGVLNYAPGDNGVYFKLSGTAVPVPPAVYLFASGLFGLVGMARRKSV